MENERSEMDLRGGEGRSRVEQREEFVSRKAWEHVELPLKQVGLVVLTHCAVENPCMTQGLPSDSALLHVRI